MNLIPYALFAAFALLPAAAQARGPFFDYAAGRQLTPDMALSGPMFPLAYGFFVLMSLTMLAFAIFWILMIIDAWKRDWRDRTLWLLVLVFSVFVGLHWLSALLYYFLVKRKDIGGRKPAAKVSPPAPKA